MIELADITKIYPMGATEVRALDGVSLRIEKGEFVAIVGASGSGKSTIMHLIGCLDRPTSGTYHLLGDTVSSLNDRELARIRNRSVGFVFQTFNLISRMSAWENVAVPLFYARQTVTKPKALAALERVGLTDRAGHQSNELSGGERQRVAIARAMVNRPGLILADEPTGNLDSRTGDQIIHIFHELHRAGATVILVTHEADIAEQAQRIVTMRDGKIIEDRPSRRAREAGQTGTRVSAETTTVGAVDDEEPASEPTGPPVVHPNAKRALTWAIMGPVFFAVLCGWAMAGKALSNVNPGFVRTVGPVVSFGLLAMAFVAPIAGFVNGRKGARWVRVAPARFTGLGRARLAQWMAGIYLLLLIGLVGLVIALAWVRAQMGGPPG